MNKLQLIKQPGTGSATGMAWSTSPSSLKFVRKGIFTTVGKAAEYLIIIDSSNLPASGDTIILAWSGVSLTFTFDAADPDDPLYLTPWTGSFNNAAETLVRDLNRNTDLSQYYRIILLSSNGTLAHIWLQALNTGTNYNLDTTGSTITMHSGSGGTAGIDEEVKEDYRLRMNVEMITGIHTEPRSSGVITLEACGTFDRENDLMLLEFFDLPAIARGLLDSKLPHNALAPYIMDYALAFAQIELIEEYDGQKWKARIDGYGDIPKYLPAMIFNGGVQLADMPGDVNIILNHTAYKFLTAQPREKVVDKESPEWLSIYLPPGDYSIHYVTYYTDGTTGDKTILYSHYLHPEILTIPTGWNQCDLGSLDPDKVATYYEVYIWDEFQREYLSEIYTYILDSRYFRDKKYFIVKNSLGGWDTFRTTGAAKYSDKFTRTSAVTTLDADSRTAAGTIRMTVAEDDRIQTIRTGWLMDRDEAEFFRQLLLSTYVAEVLPLVPKSGNTFFRQPFVAMNVQADSIELFDEGDGKWCVEWKQSPAHKEINYSKLTPANEVYYDSRIEFWISGPSSISLSILKSVNALRYTVNGNVISTSGTTILTGSTQYHFVMDGEAFSELQITCNTAGTTICIKRISSADLKKLYLIDFDKVDARYLVGRMSSLYRMEIIHIDTADSDFLLDELLIECQQLVTAGVYSLTTLEFPASTPGTTGSLAKTQLTGFGLTVTTL